MKWMKTLGEYDNKSLTSLVIIKGFSMAMLVSRIMIYDLLIS